MEGAGGNLETGFKYSLDGVSINPRVAPSFAKTMHGMTNLHTLSLVNTMLNQESFNIFMSNAPKTLVELDLS